MKFIRSILIFLIFASSLHARRHGDHSHLNVLNAISKPRVQTVAPPVIVPQVASETVSTIVYDTFVISTREVVARVELAVFNKIGQFWNILPCDPLPAKVVQSIRERGGAARIFNELLQSGVVPERLCQFYPMCAFYVYRCLIETLPCFDQVAMHLSERAKIDPVLAAKMSAIWLENGTTALDYYHQKAAEARARGKTLDPELSKSIEQVKLDEAKAKVKSIFTVEKIAQELAKLTKIKPLLDPVMTAAQTLWQLAVNGLKTLNTDVEEVQEVRYTLSPAAQALVRQAKVDVGNFQTCLGYAFQQALHQKIVQALEALAALTATHNLAWVNRFKNQAVERLNTALTWNKNGDISLATHGYADVCSITTKYIERVANGQIDYEKSYGPQALVALKESVSAKITSLQKLLDLDPSFFIDYAGKPSSDSACKKLCRPGCTHLASHEQQRAIQKQFNHLGSYRNAIDTMMRGDHRLFVTSFDCPPDWGIANSASRIHITGNIIEVALATEVLGIRTALSGIPVSQQKDLQLVLADTTIKLIQTNTIATDGVECFDVTLTTLAAPVQEHGAQEVAGVSSQEDALMQTLTKHMNESLTRQMNEIVSEFMELVDFGKGFLLGARDAAAPLGYALTYPDHLPEILRDKIDEFRKALRILGDKVSNHLKDRFIAMTGATLQERQAAAQRMIDRGNKIILWAQHVGKKIGAMSTKDWGHATGRVTFDMAAFSLAGKALSAVNIGLQEVKYAELALKCEKTTSKTLAELAGQLDALTAKFAQNVAKTPLPVFEAEIVDSSARKSLQLLRQEAERFIPGKHILQSMSVAEALKNIPAICAQLDPSVGNIAKLEKALEAFKDLPNALSTDSPITKLIQNGYAGATTGNLATARGAAFELEAAYECIQQGKKIVDFNLKYKGAYASKEFDFMTTANELFECKNIDWAQCNAKQILDKIAIAKQQADIAKELGINFTYRSKYVLPDTMKLKFREFKINFIEG